MTTMPPKAMNGPYGIAFFRALIPSRTSTATANTAPASSAPRIATATDQPSTAPINAASSERREQPLERPVGEERDLRYEHDDDRRQNDHVRDQPPLKVDRGEEQEHGAGRGVDDCPATQSEADEKGCGERRTADADGEPPRARERAYVRDGAASGAAVQGIAQLHALASSDRWRMSSERLSSAAHFSVTLSPAVQRGGSPSQTTMTGT
jgi:hypothetical protein